MSYWNKVLNKQISRRRTLAIMGGTAASAAFLAACGGDDGEETPSTNNQGSGATEEGKAGGSLRIAFPSEPHNLDPHVVGQNTYTVFHALETLTTFDDKVQPVGMLAESWEQSGDGLTLVLKLRQGVTWHTGREFTSEDVVWNMERVKDPNVPFAAYAGMARWFTKVETPNKNTITLTSDAPRPSMWDFFNKFPMGDRETTPAARTVGGTGPFKFEEWRQGASMKLVKNPTYWRKGRPYVDELNWQLNVDPESALALLDSGGLDVLLHPSINGFVRFRGNSNFTAVAHPNSGLNITIGQNTTEKPFDDKRVRQAMNWSLDRKRLQELVMKETTKSKSLPWNPTSPAFDKELDQFYNLDLKKAADLLRAANVTDPRSESIVSPSFAQANDFLQIWQNDLKSIGFNLSIRPVESAAFPGLVNSNPLQFHAHWAANTAEAAGVPISLFVLGSTGYGGNGVNVAGFKDDSYQALIDKAAVILDPKESLPIIAELSRKIIDSSHLMTLCSNVLKEIHTSKVKGVKPNTQGSFEFTDASFV